MLQDSRGELHLEKVPYELKSSLSDVKSSVELVRSISDRCGVEIAVVLQEVRDQKADVRRCIENNSRTLLTFFDDHLGKLHKIFQELTGGGAKHPHNASQLAAMGSGDEFRSQSAVNAK